MMSEQTKKKAVWKAKREGECVTTNGEARGWREWDGVTPGKRVAVTSRRARRWRATVDAEGVVTGGAGECSGDACGDGEGECARPRPRPLPWAGWRPWARRWVPGRAWAGGEGGTKKPGLGLGENDCTLAPPLCTGIADDASALGVAGAAVLWCRSCCSECARGAARRSSSSRCACSLLLSMCGSDAFRGAAPNARSSSRTTAGGCGCGAGAAKSPGRAKSAASSPVSGLVPALGTRSGGGGGGGAVVTEAGGLGA